MTVSKVKESEYGSVNLTFFYITQTDISMYSEKVLGDSRVMNGGSVTTPRQVREKRSVKEEIS